MIKRKKGNVVVIWLSLVVIIICFYFLLIYISYQQLNVLVYPIKKDMFYIVQNSFFSLNQEELSFYNYNVDQAKLYEKIINIVNLNYKNKVKIESITYNKNNNSVFIKYTIYFKPIVFKNILGEKVELKIKENVKLKNMEVK